MPISTTAAAVWSSVAASISALAALIALALNRTNLHQSVKPELHLLNWSRANKPRGEAMVDTIMIGKISNFGRGVAMHVFISLEGGRRGIVPLAFMSTIRSPLIAPDEEQEINIEASLLWQNVKVRKDGLRSLSLSLVIYAWDSINRRHKTTFTLFAVPPEERHRLLDAIAPGIALVTRSTTTRSVRMLKVQTFVTRLPGLKRFASL